VWTGNLPVRAARALADAGHDVRRLLDDRADGDSGYLDVRGVG
jgi:hypothetical protein